MAGTSILTAIHSVFRGVQLDLLQEEVRELRQQLGRLQDKEDQVEVELKRTRWVVELVVEVVVEVEVPLSMKYLEISI